ncbi:hypothetical protein EJ04DRAFT_554331 [Polyplosphaeria fusca]|uniref:Uncharacterized protein n=1 Tax=Polyplosphaeria fusca TaxID=682080 RepID=A0A9P4QW71_9PLEO|nr:hypothetical protein EJ04DRAFT_554331 [Polyplosphaeria fusca]
MKFFAVAAALVASVAALSYETCEVVTITVTATAPYHVPSAPASYGPTAPAPYPTTSAIEYPPYPIPSGTAPSGTAPPTYPSGTAAPSGTGVYTPSPPEFTGAASAMKVPAAIAGAAGLVAFFL